MIIGKVTTGLLCSEGPVFLIKSTQVCGVKHLSAFWQPSNLNHSMLYRRNVLSDSYPNFLLTVASRQGAWMTSLASCLHPRCVPASFQVGGLMMFSIIGAELLWFLRALINPSGVFSSSVVLLHMTSWVGAWNSPQQDSPIRRSLWPVILAYLNGLSPLSRIG